MRTTIQKWGNSYALRIPKQIITHLGLRAGSSVVIKEANETVIVTKIAVLGTATTKDWKNYLIPMKKRGKVNISGHVDEIVYGHSAR